MTSLIPHKYPTATIENSRLQLQMENLQTELPIILEESNGYLPFTVMTPSGEQILIWIEVTLLKETFKVSERLIVEASKTYDLMQIILYKIIKNNDLFLNCSRLTETLQSFAEQRECKALHLSKLDYLELPRNIYACDEAVVFGNSLLDDTPLTRVEHVILPENFSSKTVLTNAKEQLLRISAKVKQFYTKYTYVAEPLLTVNYISFHKRLKNVTFYRSYPTMNELLAGTQPLDDQTQICFATTLLMHPALRVGTNNYLNPNTIFIDEKGALLIGGMEYFSDDQTSPIISPVTAWSPPEYRRHAIIYPNKTHVWSIGAILWCMQHNSLTVPFTSEMTQTEINKIISDDPLLTQEWKYRISMLLIENPYLRPDMNEALILLQESLRDGIHKQPEYLIL